VGKELVSLLACSSYEPSCVQDSLRKLLAPLGGMEAFVKPGQRVLLKPNFLSAESADKPLCTNPAVIIAVAEEVARCGGIVSIGDSPGLTTCAAVAEKLGLTKVAAERGWRLVEFTEPVRSEGRTFHSIEIAREVLEAEVVLNLPKFKTHGMMGLTLGVKNLFGCIVGKRKAAYHLHVRESRELFAKLLLDIAEKVNPRLTIVDAVIGMEGEGPSGGDARAMGFLAASGSLWGLETACSDLAGYRAGELPIENELRHRLEGAGESPECELVGDEPGQFRMKDFKRPSAHPMAFGLPGWIRRPLRSLLLPRPVVDNKICIGCGNCARACPSSVIKIVGGKATIRLSDCIRCFCCSEVCPVKAVRIAAPRLKLLSR